MDAIVTVAGATAGDASVVAGLGSPDEHRVLPLDLPIESTGLTPGTLLEVLTVGKFRYRGTLCSVANGTWILRNVESFGTEDRARSDGLAIPPRKDISNYVRFDWLCIQAVKIIPEKTEKERPTRTSAIEQIVQPRETYDVFLCHAGEEKREIVSLLFQGLTEHGLRVFVDYVSLPQESIGTRQEPAILQALETASVVVVIVTEWSLTKAWPLKEIGLALHRYDNKGRIKNIIPVFFSTWLFDPATWDAKLAEFPLNQRLQATLHFTRLSKFIGIERDMHDNLSDFASRVADHVASVIASLDAEKAVQKLETAAVSNLQEIRDEPAAVLSPAIASALSDIESDVRDAPQYVVRRLLVGLPRDAVTAVVRSAVEALKSRLAESAFWREHPFAVEWFISGRSPRKLCNGLVYLGRLLGFSKNLSLPTEPPRHVPALKARRVLRALFALPRPWMLLVAPLSDGSYLFDQWLPAYPTESKATGLVLAACPADATFTAERAWTQVHVGVTPAPHTPPQLPPDFFVRNKQTEGRCVADTMRPPPLGFVGRKQVLDELVDTFWTVRATGKEPLLVGLRGMAGIGKSALALVFADTIRSYFPDARLFLDGRCSQPNPPSPEMLLSQVIRAFRPMDCLSDDRYALCALFKEVLQGKHVLLVLDNATKDQADLLVPTSTCALIVTSQSSFLLGTRAFISLECLNDEESVALLRNYYPPLSGEEATALVKLCANHPLALSIAGAHLDQDAKELHCRADVKGYIASLKAVGRLKHLDNAATAGEIITISDRLGLSENRFLWNPMLRDAWRQLCVFGDSFDTRAAIDVVGAHEETLRLFVRYSMVERDGSRRYRLHDLAAEYARAQLDECALMNVRLAHAKHFTKLAKEADEKYNAGSFLEGLNVFDLERSHFEAAYSFLVGRIALDVTSSQAASLIVTLINSLAFACNIRFHPKLRIAWHESQLKAATLIGDRTGECGAYCGLGNAFLDLGELITAELFYKCALLICSEVGDRRCESICKGSIGSIYRYRGDPMMAKQLLNEALLICRDPEAVDKRRESMWLCCLGSLHKDSGDLEIAEFFYAESLKIIRNLGDRRGESTCLGIIGSLHRVMGKPASNIFKEALAISRELGDRQQEAKFLGHLGRIHRDIGHASRNPDELQRAKELCDQALLICQDIGDRLIESSCLGILGSIAQYNKDLTTAYELFMRSLTISRDAGDRLRELTFLGQLVVVSSDTGDLKHAKELCKDALTISRQVGDTRSEVVLLNILSCIDNGLESHQKKQPTMLSAETSLIPSTSVFDRHGPLIDVYLEASLAKFIVPDEYAPTARNSNLILHYPDRFHAQLTRDRCCIVDKSTFETQFHEITGVFHDMPSDLWKNLFVAGGAVLGAILPLDADWQTLPMIHPKLDFSQVTRRPNISDVSSSSSRTREAFLRHVRYAGGDVDCFLYGITDPHVAKAKVRTLIEFFKGKMQKCIIVQTLNTITLVDLSRKLRHVQIVLRLYESEASILNSCDVDCCCVGYNGNTVLMTPRARLAIMRKVNIVDLCHRGNSYEERLCKYATRGFAIEVPLLVRSLIHPDFTNGGDLRDNQFLSSSRWEQSAGKLTRLLLIEASVQNYNESIVPQTYSDSDSFNEGIEIDDSCSSSSFAASGENCSSDTVDGITWKYGSIPRHMFMMSWEEWGAVAYFEAKEDE